MEITVVTATIGRPQLAECLERLAGQSAGAGAFRVVLSVDSRAEPIREQVRSLAAASPLDVRVVTGGAEGVSAARNAGLAEVGAGLVLFLGDDILAEPRLVAEHLEWHRRHPAEEVCVLGHVRWADRLRQTALHRWLDRGVQFQYGSIRGEEAGWGHFYCTNLSAKVSFLRRARGFDESFRFGYEELELSRRLHDMGLRLLYNRRAGAEHLHEPTLDGWRARMRIVARAERQMMRVHPDFKPYFHDKLTAALGHPPSRGLAVRAEPLVPEWMPWLGRRVRERVDVWFCQQLAPAFLEAWEEVESEGPEGQLRAAPSS